MQIMVPFSSYSLVPAQTIVKENIRLGHVSIHLKDNDDDLKCI